MSVSRLQALAREAVYEPSRGAEDDGPEPMRGVVREIPARVGGNRLFIATDEHGELRALGVMEPGGDVKRIAVGMYSALDADVRWLKVV